tara:strand:- start:627 stop:1289 length:663 start_codon:yes stop_codon:yes gene_type:complete
MGCFSDTGHWLLDDGVKYQSIKVRAKLKKRIYKLAKPKEVRMLPDLFDCVVEHAQCCSCKQWLPLNVEYFYVSKRNKMGYTGKCKECHEKYRTNRRMTEDTKIWFSERSSAAKQRIKGKNLAFTISYKDLDYPAYCPITGLKLTYLLSRGGTGRKRLHAASIDRIDSNLGYVPGNVRIISWAANWMKSYLDEDNFLDIVEKIYNTCIAKDELECKCRTVA